MAEQENVALVQKILEAFGRGDVQTILESCSADCEFYSPGPAVIPYSGRKHGQTGMQEYFSALIGTQSDADLSIERVLAQGDMVVAIGQYHAKVKATNWPIHSPVVLTWQIAGGKVIKYSVLSDTASIAASYSAGQVAAV
jgi:ketosteroid isomerase-like protein